MLLLDINQFLAFYRILKTFFLKNLDENSNLKVRFNKKFLLRILNVMLFLYFIIILISMDLFLFLIRFFIFIPLPYFSHPVI